MVVDLDAPTFLETRDFHLTAALKKRNNSQSALNCSGNHRSARPLMRRPRVTLWQIFSLFQQRPARAREVDFPLSLSWMWPR